MYARLVRYIKRGLGIIVLAAAVLYAGDYLSLRYRIPAHREQFGSFEVRHFYAVTLKNHKTEYLYDDPRDEVCVNSLFPHYGYDPCWYVARHPEQRIDIDTGAFRLKINTP